MRIESSFNYLEKPLHYALEQTRSDLVMDKIEGYCLGTLSFPITIIALPGTFLVDIINGLAKAALSLFRDDFDDDSQQLLMGKAVALPIQQLLFGIGVVSTAFLVSCFGIIVLGTFEAGISLTAVLWNLMYQNGRFIVSLLPKEYHNPHMTIFNPDRISFYKLENLAKRAINNLNHQDADVGDKIFKSINEVVNKTGLSGGFGRKIQIDFEEQNANYFEVISKLDIFLMLRVNNSNYKNAVIAKFLDIYSDRSRDAIDKLMEGEENFASLKERELLMQVILKKEDSNSLPYERETLYKLIDRDAQICRGHPDYFANSF